MKWLHVLCVSYGNHVGEFFFLYFVPIGPCIKYKDFEFLLYSVSVQQITAVTEAYAKKQ